MNSPRDENTPPDNEYEGVRKTLFMSNRSNHPLRNHKNKRK